MAAQRIFKFSAASLPRFGTTSKLTFAPSGRPVYPAFRAAIIRWAEKQSDKPTLSEAIRRLVELGLKVKREKT
jgi:hypothetical protein